MTKPVPYLVSLDIGSSKVCALIAETKADGNVEIVGKGTAAHKGARKGNIIDVPATVEAIKSAIEEAEIMAGVQVERAVVGIADPDVKSYNSRQSVAVAAKNREISREDIARALDAARAAPIPPEWEILHVLQREFAVDGQEGVADPLGMVGSKLEADVHVVTVRSGARENLLNCINRAGVEVIELVLEPLAAGEAVLTPDEKDFGVVLVDIGAGTSEIAVWRNGALAHTSVVRVGGDHFTNDLAVVLKTPVTEAERLKRRYGAALEALVPEDEMVDVPLTGGRGMQPVSRRMLAGILHPRAEELLEKIWETVTHEVPSRELRAGLVLTGGGAELDGITVVAEETLDIAVRKGRPRDLSGLTDVVAGPEWAVAAGLLLYRRGAARPSRPAEKGSRDILAGLKKKFGSLFGSHAF